MRYARERLGWPPGGILRCSARRPGQDPCPNTQKPGEHRCVKHGGAPGKSWERNQCKIANRSRTARC